MKTLARSGRFMETESWTQENDVLRVISLPAHGGKIASIWHKEKGFELLFQNPFGYFRCAELGSAFQNFEACGFDDAFPNITAEAVETDNGMIEYYDHGEIWSAQFSCKERAGCLAMTYNSPILGYDYKKTITLSGNTVRMDYSICNVSSNSFPCIWTCHCLVNHRNDMRLIFPKDTSKVLTVADSGLLGPHGRAYCFPKDLLENGDCYDFRTVPKVDYKTTIKYYCLHQSKQGVCGYIYPSERIAAELHYDPVVLPYLGFWMTAGGFRGDVNCAFEPSNGFYDSISNASENGKCLMLNPKDRLDFWLEIKVGTL